MITSTDSTAEMEWTSTAQRRTGIETRSGKNCCQIISPEITIASSSQNMPQKTSF